MQLIEIRRYPVKSMGGESLRQVSVTDEGLDADRIYGVLGGGRMVGSAKHPPRWGALLHCTATSDERGVRVTFPDGAAADAGTPECEERLSQHLGHAVQLSPTPPEDPHLERSWPGGARTAPPEVGDDATVGVTVTPIRGTRTGRFFDFAALHVMTTGTLELLCDGDRVAAQRRFRPNLVVDGEPFAEQAWLGQQLRIGDEVVVDVTSPTPRCAVPTLAQPGVAQDRKILRRLAALNRVKIAAGQHFTCAGVYADVAVAGTISQGVAVAVLG